MYQWQTLSALSGPELPEEPVRLTQRICIRPRNAQEASEKYAPANINPTIEAHSGLYVSHYPPRDEVHGTHRIQIDIRAETEDEALEKYKQICDRTIASLSLAVSGTPYFAQLLKFRRVDQTEEYHAWSQWARFSILSVPTPLDNKKLKFSLELARLIEDDETANNAFLHIYTAWQLQTTAGAKPLKRSILQHYVLSVEAVVNGAMSKFRKSKKDAIKLEEQRFAKEFSESLAKRADKAKAIRDASTKLREISLANMIPSIDAIGPIMGIPGDTCAIAKDLYRFRSRNLSHPGKNQDDEMSHWLDSGSKSYEHCLADTVARQFLLAYIAHISR